MKNNIELMARVAGLEEDLSVWKQARSAALDSVERERREHEEEVAALKKQVAALEASQVSVECGSRSCSISLDIARTKTL